MSHIIPYPCLNCNKNVISDAIECSLCSVWCHRKSAKLSKKMLNSLSKENEYWYCSSCKETFPFNAVLDDEFAYLHSSIENSQEYFELLNKCKDLKMNYDLYFEYDVCDFEDKVDPNNNFLADIDKSCNYFTNDEFNAKFKCCDSLSIIHFNCRSIKANFDNMYKYLESLQIKFDVIAVSETWLTEHDDINDFILPDYEILSINRTNKRGGGVMLYISNNIEYEKLNDLSFVVDDMFEVLSVELKIKNAKNIVVSCLYRSPGSCLEEFNNKLIELFNRCKGSKSHLLCGDFNVNILNYKSHKGTRSFIDVWFNAGLFPLINLPTRISSENSTLIDNIFSNISDDSSSGVLIDDTVSDHLLVFSCLSYKGFVKEKVVRYNMKRDISPKNVENFKKDLVNVEWNFVYNSENCSEAFDEFIHTVKSLYNKNCPVKKVRLNSKANVPPWLTKSLIKACRRKTNCIKFILIIRMNLSTSVIKTG